MLDTYVVTKPFRFDGSAYARGDRFKAPADDPITARKVEGLKRRHYIDIWTRTRRKEAASE